MSKQKTLGTALEHRIVERAQAAGHEASRQPGSGIFAAHPKDFILEDWLGEAKVRATRLNAKGERCITIDLDWLRGVQKAGKEHGFRGGILVVNPKGSRKPIVVLDLDDFLAMLEFHISES